MNIYVSADLANVYLMQFGPDELQYGVWEDFSQHRLPCKSMGES